MRKTVTILAIIAIAATAWGNGVNLNSPGTRALSMGGAYISIADDYSAPYWNPAGLQKSEGMKASFFLTDIIPSTDYKNDDLGIDASTVTNHYMAPNAAFLWNCKMNEKLHMGLSLIVPAGLGTEWEGEDFTPLNGPSDFGGVPNAFASDEHEWESYLGVFNISLSSSYNFGDKLNVGGAFHLVHGNMIMKRGVDKLDLLTGLVDPTIPAGTPIPGEDGMMDSQYDEESDGWGWGIGLGFQFEATEKITVGAAMRTRMTVGFKGDATVDNSLAGNLLDSEFDRDITFPLWVGGGIAFRPNEKLLLAAEAQWTQWSETEDYLIAEYGTGDTDSLTLLWEDAVQIRFGGEYMLNEKLALRAGFYIDPAPSPDKTLMILIPNADILGYTLGAGYTVNKFSFDATIEYLKGKTRDISDDVSMEGVGMPGQHDFDIWAPSFAITYTFK